MKDTADEREGTVCTARIVSRNSVSKSLEGSASRTFVEKLCREDTEGFDARRLREGASQRS